MSNQLGHVTKVPGFVSIKIDSDGIPKLFNFDGEQISGVRKLQLNFEVDKLVTANVEFYVESVEMDLIEFAQYKEEKDYE